MPSLRVDRNGQHLCTAGSNEVWMFSAGVWADVFGPEASMLNVTGSSNPEGEEGSDFLIWECPLALSRGDSIEMSFEGANASLPLPTPFRDEPDQEEEPAALPWSNPPTEEEIAAFESRPAQNIGTEWTVTIGDRKFHLAPDVSRQHVSLYLLWRNRHPEHIRVSLCRKSLREVIDRLDGEEFFADELPIGTRLAVAIAA